MIQKESGGNLAEVLDKTSHVIRERFRLKRQVNVHTAQGRMTGWILTLLPWAGNCFVHAQPANDEYFVDQSDRRQAALGSGCMFVIGGLIIRQIVNMDV